MEQPKGFNVKGKEELACKLKRIFHGLKQAPRQWYKKFYFFIKNHGFNKTMCDYCVFVRKFGNNDFIILLFCVDDILIFGQNVNKIGNLKKERSKSFTMNDLGSSKQILGMNISHHRKTRKLWLSL